MHVIHISPPLQIVSIDNGCEGYNTNVYIPSETNITSVTDTDTKFLLILMQYINIWFDMVYVTAGERDYLGIKHSEFLPMALNHLSKCT